MQASVPHVGPVYVPVWISPGTLRFPREPEKSVIMIGPGMCKCVCYVCVCMCECAFVYVCVLCVCACVCCVRASARNCVMFIYRSAFSQVQVVLHLELTLKNDCNRNLKACCSDHFHM